MAAGSVIDRLPGRHAAAAIALGARRRISREWAGTPPHRWLLAQGRPEGLAADPQDLRPASASVAARSIIRIIMARFLLRCCARSGYGPGLQLSKAAGKIRN